MNDCMTFPDTVEEFMEQYKVVDTEHIYTNGTEFVPIFRMKQWFKHLPSIQPDTTTHDSIPAETGKKDDYGTSGDCISRQQAVDALRAMQTYKMFAGDDLLLIDQAGAQTELMMLPSVQPEQTKMIKEIRKWINSKNRGNADYFIVDKIEGIINKYE